MHLSTQDYLTKDYLTNRVKQNLRYHSSPVHPLYNQELKNGTQAIIGFLNSTVLAQARNLRYKHLYELAAEKCYNNSTNNYSFSEAYQCEKILFNKDPVLYNINHFISHMEVTIQDHHEKAVDGIECSKEYLRTHKEFLLRLNFLYRYYFYFTARQLFLTNNN